MLARKEVIELKRKVISTLLIISGILIIAYPVISQRYHDYKQKEILEGWQESLFNIEDINEDNLDLPSNSNPPPDGEESVDKLDNNKESGIEGILKIDKIDLEMPILKGASKENMSMSIASVDHTGSIGEVGNYSIAGHRSRTYGRHFNRLEEVEVEDKILVNDGNQDYEYTVVEKFKVLPEEVWVLEGNEKDKEITLITCHPMRNPTHRLIVKGKIIED